LQQTLEDSSVAISATTLHSSAQKCLKQHYEQMLQESSCNDENRKISRQFLKSKTISDKQLQEWISKELDEVIEEFLENCCRTIETSTVAPQNATEEDATRQSKIKLRKQ
jgi:hypothetical protein